MINLSYREARSHAGVSRSPRNAAGDKNSMREEIDEMRRIEHGHRSVFR